MIFFFFPSERASESIHQLKYALEDKQFAKDDSEAGSDQSSEDRDNDDSGNAAWQELQNSHAGKMTLKANGLKIVRNDTNFNEKSKYFCYNKCVLSLPS